MADTTLEIEQLGEYIDQLTEARLKKAEAERQADVHGKECNRLEVEIIRIMAEAKLDKAAHGGTSVSPKESVYPHVEDWDKFGNFILDNKYLHLLERRVTVTGYRELINLGREVPGVVPFVKTKLSVTKALR